MEKEEVIGKISSGAVLSLFIPQLICSIIGFLIGLFMFIINLLFTISCLTYVETTATIVDIYYDRELESYIPVYEYDFNGETVRANGTSILDRGNIKIGDEEIINYNPKNYKQFNEGSRKNLLLSWAICAFILFCSIEFLYIFIKTLKKFKRNKFDLYNVVEEEQAMKENDEAINNNSNNNIWSILALIVMIAMIVASLVNIK